MRTSDLASRQGLSTQAVRNYERDGLIPAAERSPTGYRTFGALHDAALGAYRTLTVALGHSHARTVMRAVHAGDLTLALRTIDEAHEQLLRDRRTLDESSVAVRLLHESDLADGSLHRGDQAIGQLAAHLGISPATLRKWERLGLLQPERDYDTGHRRYAPADLRDAELAHLLRRGGHGLAEIAGALDELRAAKSGRLLGESLARAQQRLDHRARSMLTSSAALDRYLQLRSATADG
jgi:DNA-binding transcriptional MerR regulator